MKITTLTPTEGVLAELGRRLALARKAQRLSQQELAQAAGLGVATLRRIETGSDGQLGSWIKVLNALGMIGALEGLLPAEIRSPMAEAKASGIPDKKRRSPAENDTDPWNGEAP